MDRQSEPWKEKLAKPFFTPYRLAFLAILILAVVIYLPTLKGDRIWDDFGLLSGASVGGGTSVVDALTKPFLGAYFRPLVSLSFHFENQLWHGNPFLYHQTNILLHLAATASLMGLVLTAFGRPVLALISGLLFAIQPAQVSTVAWIGGRTDSMCTLFVILFGYTLILGIRSMGAKRIAWLSASILAFFFAALTKEQVVAMILLVPFALKAFAPEGRRVRAGDYARITFPYLLASIAFVVLWFAYNTNPFEAWSRGAFGQLMAAGQTTVYYSMLFLAPSSKWMHMLSLGNLERAGLPLTFAGVALLMAYVAGVIWIIRKNPKLGWFATYVALALLPVTNLIPLPSLLIAPYRAGVAGAGVAVLLAWLITSIPSKKAAYLIGGAFAVWCGWLTYWGGLQWHSAEQIFSRITAEDPYSIVARRNMSSYLMKNSKFEEAAVQLRTILTMLYGSSDWENPDSAHQQYLADPVLNRKVVENQGNEVESRAWLAELFAQLGFANGKLNKIEQSRNCFEAAVRIYPKSANGHVGLSQFARFEKRYDDAIGHLRLALANHPNDPGLYRWMGQVYTDQGKFEHATLALSRSIELEPWSSLSYQDLAEVQVRQGRVKDALTTLHTALNCQVRDEEGIQTRIYQLENPQKGGG